MTHATRSVRVGTGAVSAALAALVLANTPAAAQSTDAGSVGLKSELGIGRDGNRMPIKAKSDGAKSVVGETLILRDFYEKLEFRAIWFTDAGPTAKAKTFLDRLGKAANHGLNPEDYLYSHLSKGVAQYDPTQRSVLEVLMSRAFTRYAADVNAGRIGPTRAIPNLYVRPVRPDPERLLQAAAREPDFAKFIDSLPPQTPQYTRLVKAFLIIARSKRAADGSRCRAVRRSSPV